MNTTDSMNLMKRIVEKLQEECNVGPLHSMVLIDRTVDSNFEVYFWTYPLLATSFNLSYLPWHSSMALNFKADVDEPSDEIPLPQLSRWLKWSNSVQDIILHSAETPSVLQGVHPAFPLEGGTMDAYAANSNEHGNSTTESTKIIVAIEFDWVKLLVALVLGCYLIGLLVGLCSKLIQYFAFGGSPTNTPKVLFVKGRRISRSFSTTRTRICTSHLVLLWIISFNYVEGHWRLMNSAESANWIISSKVHGHQANESRDERILASADQTNEEAPDLQSLMQQQAERRRIVKLWGLSWRDRFSLHYHSWSHILGNSLCTFHLPDTKDFPYELIPIAGKEEKEYIAFDTRITTPVYMSISCISSEHRGTLSWEHQRASTPYSFVLALCNNEDLVTDWTCWAENLEHVQCGGEIDVRPGAFVKIFQRQLAPQSDSEEDTISTPSGSVIQELDEIQSDLGEEDMCALFQRTYFGTLHEGIDWSRRDTQAEVTATFPDRNSLADLEYLRQNIHLFPGIKYVKICRAHINPVWTSMTLSWEVNQISPLEILRTINEEWPDVRGSWKLFPIDTTPSALFALEELVIVLDLPSGDWDSDRRFPHLIERIAVVPSNVRVNAVIKTLVSPFTRREIIDTSEMSGCSHNYACEVWIEGKRITHNNPMRAKMSALIQVVRTLGGETMPLLSAGLEPSIIAGSPRFLPVPEYVILRKFGHPWKTITFRDSSRAVPPDQEVTLQIFQQEETWVSTWLTTWPPLKLTDWQAVQADKSTATSRLLQDYDAISLLVELHYEANWRLILLERSIDSVQEVDSQIVAHRMFQPMTRQDIIFCLDAERFCANPTYQCDTECNALILQVGQTHQAKDGDFCKLIITEKKSISCVENTITLPAPTANSRERSRSNRRPILRRHFRYHRTGEQGSELTSLPHRRVYFDHKDIQRLPGSLQRWVWTAQQHIEANLDFVSLMQRSPTAIPTFTAISFIEGTGDPFIDHLDEHEIRAPVTSLEIRYKTRFSRWRTQPGKIIFAQPPPRDLLRPGTLVFLLTDTNRLADAVSFNLLDVEIAEDWTGRHSQARAGDQWREALYLPKQADLISIIRLFELDTICAEVTTMCTVIQAGTLWEQDDPTPHFIFDGDYFLVTITSISNNRDCDTSPEEGIVDNIEDTTSFLQWTTLWLVAGNQFPRAKSSAPAPALPELPQLDLPADPLPEDRLDQPGNIFSELASATLLIVLRPHEGFQVQDRFDVVEPWRLSSIEFLHQISSTWPDLAGQEWTMTLPFDEGLVSTIEGVRILLISPGGEDSLHPTVLLEVGWEFSQDFLQLRLIAIAWDTSTTGDGIIRQLDAQEECLSQVHCFTFLQGSYIGPTQRRQVFNGDVLQVIMLRENPEHDARLISDAFSHLWDSIALSMAPALVRSSGFSAIYIDTTYFDHETLDRTLLPSTQLTSWKVLHRAAKDRWNDLNTHTLWSVYQVHRSWKKEHDMDGLNEIFLVDEKYASPVRDAITILVHTIIFDESRDSMASTRARRILAFRSCRRTSNRTTSR